MLIFLKWISIAISLNWIIACSPSQQGIFGKKTPHERYGEGLSDAGLSNTMLGRRWFASANLSLQKPVSVTLPYQETGYFEMDKPSAFAYIFNARRGEQILVNVNTNPSTGFLLFVELWQAAQSQSPELLVSADTLSRMIRWEAKNEGQYIVRLQPELLQGLSYTITISTGPSLAFPINKSDNPRVISTWGDPRDGNSRSHEGIDILAKKYTPVVAAADGRVTSVKEGGLGGKVVFMRPKGREFSLYYAHLDTQLVQNGDNVAAGDTLGLVGNTGNARNTVAHLHFGIYTDNGAVDPLPFVNVSRPNIKKIKADTSLITEYIRTKVATSLQTQTENPGATTIPLGSLAKILAATDDFYRVEFPGNITGFIKSSAITTQPLRTQTLSQNTQLLDQPYSSAAVKISLTKGVTITIKGTYNDYSFVQAENHEGWIRTVK